MKASPPDGAGGGWAGAAATIAVREAPRGSLAFRPHVPAAAEDTGEAPPPVGGIATPTARRSRNIPRERLR